MNRHMTPHVYMHLCPYTHATRDYSSTSTSSVLPWQECASTLCTSTSTCLHVLRGELYTHSEQDTSLHTHLFIHSMALSILGSTGCTCMSSSYRKSLVKKLNPSYSSLCFSHLPFSSAQSVTHPKKQGWIDSIQGTYLFREVSQRRLHTVAHNMLRLPFRWTWL